MLSRADLEGAPRAHADSDLLQQADFIHKLWAPRALISTGGYERETALKAAEETGAIIGFGQKFLANVSSSCGCGPRVATPLYKWRRHADSSLDSPTCRSVSARASR